MYTFRDEMTTNEVEALAEALANLEGLDPNDDAVWQEKLAEAEAQLKEEEQ